MKQKITSIITTCLLSIAIAITLTAELLPGTNPVIAEAKATNPFEGHTQERPLISYGRRTGTYLRILTAEIACNDTDLKKLYKYYSQNSKKFKYVVIDFGNDNGLFLKKTNKTFIYGKISKNNSTNSYKISKKKGTIKIKGKSVIRKTGNKILDRL